MCVVICMLVYVCVFVSESMSMCVHFCKYTYLGMCLFVYIYSSMFAYTCVYMCTCDFERTTFMNMFICVN